MNVVATTEGLARVEGTELALVDLAFSDVGALLRATGSLAAVRDAAVRGRLPLAEAQKMIVTPLSTSSAIWGVGLNYHSKVAITGRRAPVTPTLYLAATSAMCGPGEDVPLPDEETDEFDYEGEIALVIGRRSYRVAENEAWAHVAGITAANDLTARDVMKATASPALAKSFPGCKPLGASVLGIEEISDPDDVGVRVLVNEELRQEGRSSEMIFSVPELIARISRHAVLDPGDVVLTGTPAGTGQDRRSFLRVGDVVSVEVDGVLRLCNTIGPPVRKAGRIRRSRGPLKRGKDA